jgi:hypothetical protein
VAVAGVGKKLLHVDGLTKDRMKDAVLRDDLAAGDCTLLVGDSGKVNARFSSGAVGGAARLRRGVMWAV